MGGLAEIPENSYDPPHFKPTHKCESAAGARVALLASIKPKNVFRTASESMANSEPLCCCSRMIRGLLNAGLRLWICWRKVAICADWQPRLRTVAPATFGGLI